MVSPARARAAAASLAGLSAVRMAIASLLRVRASPARGGSRRRQAGAQAPERVVLPRRRAEGRPVAIANPRSDETRSARLSPLDVRETITSRTA